MENCELTRYYTVMEEEMADNWDEMRKKIHQEIFKMELENDELPYTGPDTTTGEENAKLKRDIGSSPVSLATSEPVSPACVIHQTPTAKVTLLVYFLVLVFTEITTKFRNEFKPTAENPKESEPPLSTEEIED